MPARAQVFKPLRRQMVRRRPAPSELGQRRAITITPRDQEILRAVYHHGFLTVEHIELAFFPPCDTRTSSSSAAYDRTRSLWLWGYLEKVELPVARMLGGRLPCLFAIGTRAVSTLAASLGNGTRPVHERRLDRLDDRNIDHDLRAASFWANLTVLARSATLIQEWAWTAERDIRAQKRFAVDPDTNKSRTIAPDGEFRVVYSDGDIQLGFLEVDMGTVPLRQFRKKMRGFDLYLNDRYGARKNVIPEVYVLAHSQRRLEELRDATNAAIADDSQVGYFFATFPVLEPMAFADTCWQDLSGEQNCLLFPKAFPDASAEVDEEEEAAKTEAAAKAAMIEAGLAAGQLRLEL